jgi:hypothetical protein
VPALFVDTLNPVRATASVIPYPDIVVGVDVRSENAPPKYAGAVKP